MAAQTTQREWKVEGKRANITTWRKGAEREGAKEMFGELIIHFPRVLSYQTTFHMDIQTVQRLNLLYITVQL